MFTYKFAGYWRDVGTVESLWAANMELLDGKSAHEHWKISDSYIDDKSNVISDRSAVRYSVMHGKCTISGAIRHSILSDSITVRQDAEINNSIIMPGAYIGKNVKIHNAIIGTGAAVLDNAEIGVDKGSDFFVEPVLCTGDISLIEPNLHVPEGMKFQRGSHIDTGMLREWIEQTEIKNNLNGKGRYNG
jgi:ADP-glucose pyrophosphorylase